MKIRKIKFGNHPVFGNIEFDFTNEGKTVDTIILAGENGSGKSLLLNALFEFSLMQPSEHFPKQTRQVEAEFPSDALLNVISKPTLNNRMSYPIKDNSITFDIDYNKEGNYQINLEYKNNYEQKGEISLFNFGQSELRGLAKTIFSDVGIYFNVEQINKVTTSEFDRNILISQRSQKNSSTEIAQLLIDLQTADNDDFTNWANKNPGKLNSDYPNRDKRIARFKNAFNFMFPSKRLTGISSKKGIKEVVFEDFGNEIPLNNLSSGEKQIAFRGSFLLRDKGSLENALVLIDEPEISLHPNWQLKILEFYKRLFQNDKGEQTSQIIIATHSPFILHNLNRYNDKVIVLKRNDLGKTEIENNPSFYGFSNEELIEKAFNTNLLNGLDKTTVYVEGIIDERYFKKTKELFKKDNIEITSIGVNQNGGANGSGKDGLNKLLSVLKTNDTLIKNRKTKIILLYDCDANKPDENNDKFLVRSLKKIKSGYYETGIENSLCLNKGFDKTIYEKTETNKVGDKTTSITVTDKVKLCDWILSLNENEQKEILKELNNTLDNIVKDI